MATSRRPPPPFGSSGHSRVNDIPARLPLLPPVYVPPTVAEETRTADRDWCWSDRYKPQLVSPDLWLGPSMVTRDTEFLRSKSIALIVYVRSQRAGVVNQPAPIRIAKEHGISNHFVPVSDTAEFGIPDLIRQLPDVIGSIRQTVYSNGPGTVLVCCDTGNELSAAIAIAWFMEEKRYQLVPACQKVQSSRFCVHVREDLRSMLSSYQDLLTAKRNVSDSQPLEAFTSEPPEKRPGKRKHEDDEMEQDREYPWQMTGVS